MSIGSSAPSRYFWLNGKIVDASEPKVHILSHSLHYGGGVFEGIRAYETQRGPAIFRAEEHFDRFYRSMKVFNYQVSFNKADLIRASHETIEKNSLKNCYIRPIAFLDQTFRGLQLPPKPTAHIAIAAWVWESYMGEEGQKSGIGVLVSKYRRTALPQEVQEAKICGNYVTSLLARSEASSQGYEEAILLDPNGYLAEGPGENLFIVKNKVLRTPRRGSILPGITRDSVMSIAENMGLKVEEAHLTVEDLMECDEAFFCGTAVEVTGIREVNHKALKSNGVGPVTQKIATAYFACVRGKSPEFSHWLSYPKQGELISKVKSV